MDEIISLHSSPGWRIPAARWFQEKWEIPLEEYLTSIDECIEGRAAKDEPLRRVLRSELSRERATRLEGSFGTQKQHYSLSRIKARNRKTEITEQKDGNPVDLLRNTYGKCRTDN